MLKYHLFEQHSNIVGSVSPARALDILDDASKIKTIETNTVFPPHGQTNNPNTNGKIMDV